MTNKVYQKVFDQIKISESAKQKLLEVPQTAVEPETIIQNKIAYFAAVVATLLVIVSVPVSAAVLYFSHSYPVENSLTHEYTAVETVKQNTGLNFYCPKTIGNNYNFLNMNVNTNEVTDQESNQVSTFYSIHASYTDDKNILIYDIIPNMQGVVSTDEENEGSKNDTQVFKGEDENGTAIQYTYTEVTENSEDIGTSELYKIEWSDENNHYRLSGYNVDLTADDLYLLATDIMSDK